MKTCSKCNIEKSLDEFYKKKSGKHGRTADCKECRKSYAKSYREDNSDKINLYQKDYRDKNPDKIKDQKKDWRERNLERDKANKKAYHEKKYTEDTKFRTRMLIRNQTLRLGKYKDKSSIDIVGCSPEMFWVMNGSPEDMSDVHIDHIVPLSWFDLSNEDHLKVCSHWSNLQYLCAEDNLSKGNSYAGSPEHILGYRGEFDIDKYVEERIF